MKLGFEESDDPKVRLIVRLIVTLWVVGIVGMCIPFASHIQFIGCVVTFLAACTTIGYIVKICFEDE